MNLINKDFLSGYVSELNKKALPREIKEKQKQGKTLIHDTVRLFLPSKVKFSFENENDVINILESHKSTKERLNYYVKIYKKLGDLIRDKKIKEISDFGCGFNPFSYIFFENYSKLKFECYDVLDVPLNEFFKKWKINGKYSVLDMSKAGFDFSGDMALMLKVDIIEKYRKNWIKEFIEKTNFKIYVVSFSTRTIGGKGKIYNRKWFEHYVKKFKFEMFEIENEKFFVVEK